MIAVIALRFAGPGARLGARPGGVPHVVPAGPTTPTGRFLPRAVRPVCRARTRRLSVVPVDTTTGLHRVCARCAVSLRKGKAREAAHLTTRSAYRARFAGVTGRQLVAALNDATTETDVDEAAHLTLLLYGVAGCRQPDPRTGRSLHDHVTRTRRRFLPADDRLAELRADAEHQRRARRQEIHEDREARIARLGIRNAKP